MAKELILTVEDDEDILELIQFNLKREGYKTKGVTSGEECMKYLTNEKADLVLLDIMLPGMDGLDICKQLKNDVKTVNIPVIMLTAKGEEADIVTGLELGAEDYITKPFSPRVLLARIKSILKRAARREKLSDDAVIEVKDIVIHPGRHEVTVQGKPVDLTYTEFRILHFLSSRPGWVYNRYQIVDAVHGEDYPVTERSVDVQIVGLRKKMGAAGEYIETVRGVGYKFRDI